MTEKLPQETTDDGKSSALNVLESELEKIEPDKQKREKILATITTSIQAFRGPLPPPALLKES